MKKLNKLNRLVVAIAAAFFVLSVGVAHAATRALGMDVSNYQDSSAQYFQAFKARGATFSIVKLGGSGGGEGSHYKNPKASAQLANAAQVGMNVGGYFWGEFGSSQSSASSMANKAISDAKADGLKPGSVIALDYEHGASSNKDANTKAIEVFGSTIEANGYKFALYSGAYYLKSYVNIEEIGQQFGTCFWVASYKAMNAQTAPDYNYFPSMNYVAMWQYGSNWYAVDGNVDLIGFMTTGGVTQNTPVKPTTPAASDNTATKYTVKSGDSWWSIANRVGVDMNLLAQLNGKTIASVIHPGDILKIKGTLDNNLTASQAKNTKASSKSNLAVDGKLGHQTILAGQKLYGMRIQDGVISRPSSYVRILQKHLGVTQDGIMGPQTIRAMQRKLGVRVDGILGPQTITAWQRTINAGTKF